MARVFSKCLRNTNQKIPRKNFRKSHETSASSIKPFSSYAKTLPGGHKVPPPQPDQIGSNIKMLISSETEKRIT